MSRRSEVVGLLTVFVCISGNACNGGAGKGCSGGGCGNGGQTIPDECMLKFTNANDYDYAADLTLASTEMTACTDGTIDWSQLTVDYRGRTVTAVDKVTIGKIDMDQATLLQAIDENTLQEQDVLTYGEIETAAGQTSAQLTEFSVIGNYFVPSDPSSLGFCEDPESTWLATAWVLDDRNVYEILSSMILVPKADSENTSASFTNDSATLDFTVDLQSLTPLTADSTCEDYGLDWSGVTADVNGAELDPLLADTLRIAHLPGTLSDVEGEFLQLDVAADQTYFLTSYGLTSIPGDSNPDQTLFQATSTDGQTFSGFTKDGVWIVDLECTADSCLSPAPLILSTVEVK